MKGSHFVIQTDHQKLILILDLKETTGHLAQWRLDLLKFDFEVVHRLGMYHQATNAMPRLPGKQTVEKM